MKVTVGKLVSGHPRFFAGSFASTANAIGVHSPVTTGKPHHACTYDNRAVAQLLADTFNAFDGIASGVPCRDWIVVNLPEEWLP